MFRLQLSRAQLTRGRALAKLKLEQRCLSIPHGLPRNTANYLSVARLNKREQKLADTKLEGHRWAVKQSTRAFSVSLFRQAYWGIRGAVGHDA